MKWYLDRAAQRGLRLTAAGYLSPVDLLEAGAVVPMHWVPFWRAENREARSPELRWFRNALTSVGLLRTEGRRLVATETGMSMRTDPFDLLMYLYSALVPQNSPFGRDAALLILLAVATLGGTPGTGILRGVLDSYAKMLTKIGWRIGQDIIYNVDLNDLPLVSILDNTSLISAALARETLLSWNLDR